MKNYRIVKETKSKTGNVSYIIEVEKSFLWWTWWMVCRWYGPMGVTIDMEFSSMVDAKLEYDKLTESTKREIIG